MPMIHSYGVSDENDPSDEVDEDLPHATEDQAYEAQEAGDIEVPDEPAVITAARRRKRGKS